MRARNNKGRFVKNSGAKKEKPVTNSVDNGLSSAIFGNPFGTQFGNQWTQQISQPDTLQTNLRYYFVTNLRQFLAQCYCEIGLVQTIVDIPVDDGLRGGLTIISKQLDEANIQLLQATMDREGDLRIVGQANKWNRLFGGAGVIVMTDQDSMQPLNIEAIQKDSPLEFRAVDMWELFYDKQNTEGHQATIKEYDSQFYTYYSTKLHASRVMKMKGTEAPSFVRPRLRGWGLSVVETLIRSINQYIKATDVGFEVLDEFKLDIYKIKNLASSLLSPKGEDTIKRRVALANHQKNYQNAITMDSEDDYVQKQLSWAGLGDAMEGIRLQIAADMRMPLTKLFGQSAAGFNAGEDDIEVYNSMVESQVRAKCKYEILKMLEIRCQKLFGHVPDDLEIEFKPLRVLGAEQEENVKTQKFNRLLAAKQQGELTTLEFRNACNRDNLLGIQLDTKENSLNPDDPDIAALLEGGPDEEPEGEDKDQDKKKENSWDEGKHPRKEDGRFGKGGGKSKKGKVGEHWSGDHKGVAIKTEMHESNGEKYIKVFIDGKHAYDDHDSDDVIDAYHAASSKSEKKENSLAYDVKAFEADGGDSQYSPWHERQVDVMDPLMVKAKDASQQVFGKQRWQFILWYFKKHGGKVE